MKLGHCKVGSEDVEADDVPAVRAVEAALARLDRFLYHLDRVRGKGEGGRGKPKERGHTSMEKKYFRSTRIAAQETQPTWTKGTTSFIQSLMRVLMSSRKDPIFVEDPRRSTTSSLSAGSLEILIKTSNIKFL
jgi:hypothetical protein